MLAIEQPVIIISIGVAFLVLFLLSLGVAQYVKGLSRQQQIIRKIQQSGQAWAQSFPVEAKGGESLLPSDCAGWLHRFLGGVGNRLAGRRSADYAAMRLKFLRAGIRGENAVAVHWGAKLFCALGLMTVVFFLRFYFFKILNNQVTMLLAVLAALIGFYLPDLIIHIKAARRREKISAGLPDALDLLVLCVEAGLGLDSAIHKVASEISLIHPVVSEEFKIMNLELRAGKSRQDALRDMGLRTNVEAFTSLVTLLIQTDKFGTSVARALRVFSDSFRKKRFQKAEEVAAKLPVKMVFPLVLFIFPSLMAVLLGPAMIRIYHVLLNR